MVTMKQVKVASLCHVPALLLWMRERRKNLTRVHASNCYVDSFLKSSHEDAHLYFPFSSKPRRLGETMSDEWTEGSTDGRMAIIQMDYILVLTHSWSRALLEKLPIVQLLENFLAFYGTRRFITAFT
jgi:hypothetical protein